jgi:hypothetical protein
MTATSIAEALARGAAVEMIYRCRAGLFASETTWRLTHEALVREGAPELFVRYDEIRRIRLFGTVGMDMMGGGTIVPAAGVCSITGKSRRRINLTSTHMLGFGRFEDRSATFEPFVERLIQHAEQASPRVVVITGLPHTLWLLWAVILVLLGGVVALAFGMLVAIGGRVIESLGSGDYRALTFSTIGDGISAMVMAVTFGASIIPLISTLRRGRQKVAWPRSRRN